MANEICISIVQSVQSETSNPTITDSYNVSECVDISIVNEITTGSMVDATGSNVHVMKDSDKDAGVVLLMSGTIDSGESLVLPILQQVGQGITAGLILPIEQEIGGLGILILPIIQEVKEVLYLTLPIEQEVITGNSLVLPINQTVAIFDSLVLPIEQEVEAITGILLLPVTQEVITGQTLTLPVTQVINPVAGDYTSDLYSSAQYWTLAVTLEGVDISDSVTGTASIQMEEGTARLADFSYLPSIGAIDQCALIGDAVTIDFILRTSSGVTVSTFRRFTGIVDSIEYDPTTSLVSLSCADDLQEIVNDMDRTVLASMIDGYYSADVFDEEDTDNWEYAEDILSTVPKSMDMNTSGTLRVTDWAAKGSADFVLTDSELQYQSPSVQLADDSELINKINLELDYRYTRGFYRTVKINWKYPRTFCQYIASSTELPSVTMVVEALEGVGWAIQAMNTTPLRDSASTLLKCIAGGAVPVGGGLTTGSGAFGWSNPHYPELLVGFGATIYKEWNQNITEKPTHIITAPQSINSCEEHEDTLTVSVDIETDDEDGEVLPTTEETSASGVNNFGSSGSCGLINGPTFGQFSSGEQPHGGTGVSRITGDANRQPAAGSLVNAYGDYYLDAGDQDRYDDAAGVAFAQARTTMLSTHRLNLVSFRRPFLPVDVHHTVEVDATRIHSRGKVKSTTEEFDIETGSATIQVTMAVSRSSDDVVVEQVEGQIPDRVSSLDYFDDLEQHNPYIKLPTQIGNWNPNFPAAGPDVSAGSAYCEDLLGFSGNYHYVSLTIDPIEVENPQASPLPGSQAENPNRNILTGFDWTADTSVNGIAWPHRLTIEVDGVQEELTDAVEVEGGDEYTTQIPNELLIINQP